MEVIFTFCEFNSSRSITRVHPARDRSTLGHVGLDGAGTLYTDAPDCGPVTICSSILHPVPIDLPAGPFDSFLGVIFGSGWPQADLSPGRGSGVLAAGSETMRRCESKQRRALRGVELGVRLVRPSLLNVVH